MMDMAHLAVAPGAARLAGVASVALALCLSAIAVGTWRHRRVAAAIPVRIHVAGTRGKSTTARMIAAGFRAGGHRVVAKSTGSVPMLILPDGREEAWPRRGPPSISEQIRFFRRALVLGAEVAVLECMAIRPELVEASEGQIVRATTAVVTNTRPDHAEEIGEAPDAAARAVSYVLPPGGVAVVTAEAAGPILRARAAAVGCVLDIVEIADPADHHAANRALALRVCARHGVPPAVAGAAIDTAGPDPGAFFARDVDFADKRFRFLNAFACNDVSSLEMHWRRTDGPGVPVVLLNTRYDRPLRTRAFVRFLAHQSPRPRLFVVGPRLSMRIARQAGWGPGEIEWMEGDDPAIALTRIAAAVSPGGLVWGVGNYRGIGEGLVRALRHGGTAC
jgi:gamma-polyglutamate synthase